MLKLSGGGAPALPGSVAATNRMLARADSAITSAYEPAPHIPPGSSNTVRSASTGPASRSSHWAATRLVSDLGPAPATCGRRATAVGGRTASVGVIRRVPTLIWRVATGDRTRQQPRPGPAQNRLRRVRGGY